MTVCIRPENEILALQKAEMRKNGYKLKVTEVQPKTCSKKYVLDE